jgi:hypothetical protein
MHRPRHASFPHARQSQQRRAPGRLDRAGAGQAGAFADRVRSRQTGSGAASLPPAPGPGTWFAGAQQIVVWQPVCNDSRVPDFAGPAWSRWLAKSVGCLADVSPLAVASTRSRPAWPLPARVIRSTVVRGLTDTARRHATEQLADGLGLPSRSSCCLQAQTCRTQDRRAAAAPAGARSDFHGRCTCSTLLVRPGLVIGSPVLGSGSARC